MLRSHNFIACSYNQPTSCYTRLSFLKNALHLATTLKKFLTILLLIALAGQVSGYLYANAEGISLMQEAEDSGEKNGEEKNEKEYVSWVSLNKIELSPKRSFTSYSSKPCLSPQLDPHSPPPDVTL